MYDGTVSFYVMDPHDPVLGGLSAGISGVFKDLNQLSPISKRTCVIRRISSPSRRPNTRPST